MATLTINCGSMKCPAPLVEISKAMKKMQSGETLEVLADDPAFCEDVKAWCEMTENPLESLAQAEGRCKAILRKKS